MKSKKTLITVLLLAMLLLSGCSPTVFEVTNVKVFYLNQSKQKQWYLTQVEIACDTEDKTRFALERVLTDPEKPEHKCAFPYGVTLVSMELEDGVATVNLSSPYDTLRGFSLSAANACMVKTLTQFEEVSQVRFLVEGRPHPAQTDRLYGADDFLDVALS